MKKGINPHDEQQKKGWTNKDSNYDGGKHVCYCGRVNSMCFICCRSSTSLIHLGTCDSLVVRYVRGKSGCIGALVQITRFWWGPNGCGSLPDWQEWPSRSPSPWRSGGCPLRPGGQPRTSAGSPPQSHSQRTHGRILHLHRESFGHGRFLDLLVTS